MLMHCLIKVLLFPFVTPSVSRKFDILPNVLTEPFAIGTPMGDSTVGKIVHKKCHVMPPNRVTHFY